MKSPKYDCENHQHKFSHMSCAKGDHFARWYIWIQMPEISNFLRIADKRARGDLFTFYLFHINDHRNTQTQNRV